MTDLKPFNRHGQKSKAYMDSLREITEADWKNLEACCITAIVSGCDDVLITLPYTCKIAKDFPKGRLTEKNGPVNVYRAKPDKIMKWLLKHGHTCVTMEQLRIQQILMTRMEKEMFENDVFCS